MILTILEAILGVAMLIFIILNVYELGYNYGYTMSFVDCFIKTNKKEGE